MESEMFGRKKKRRRTKCDDITDIIKTMSYSEMMEMGRQLYIATNLSGLSPLSEHHYAHIMYEWTHIHDVEVVSTKRKSHFNGVTTEQ